MRIPRSTPDFRALHARVAVSLALALTLAGCGSGGGAGSTPWAPPGSEGLPFATLGELEDAIAEASVSPIPEERIDTDGDSIQDVVEVRLGTAPGQSDTDRDGLVDGAELFPDGWRRPDPMTASDPRATVTRALEAFEAGETADIESLLPLLYDELRSLAGALLHHERRGHTLQPTALAHEAWLRLVESDRIQFQGRAQFLSLAARVMRRVLIDHARRHDADKRGGGHQRVTLSDATPVCGRPEVDLLALDEALTELAAIDDRKARVVTYRYFSGMTMPEVAAALGISVSTAEDDWYFARAWMARRLA